MDTETENKGEKEKNPWVWKAAIVALPVGLALSIVIALAKKVNEPAKTGMEAVTYLASDFEVSNLRDASEKIEETIGARDFESDSGKQAMLQSLALIEGSLSSINLGYRVQTDEGEVLNDRIWKNYWIDSNEKEGEGTLVVWTTYSEAQDSAAVAALLSVAEWLRGREFEQRIRVAFVRGENALPSVLANLPPSEVVSTFRVHAIGQGSEGLLKTGGGLKDSREAFRYLLTGKSGPPMASDWKLTVGWEKFVRQVRALCEEIAEEAQEKVVIPK